jgi:CelD/BcsL family acetyltransferase involved in cellulose biosynthesis
MAVQAIARNGETDMSFAGELGRSRPEAHLPEGAHMTLITTPPGLVALEAGWRALEAAHARPHNVFQTYDWVAGWSQAYAGPGAENSMAIVAGLRDGKLAFVLPLMQVQIGPLAVLRWLTEPLAQYGDVLIDRPEDLDGWMNASLAFIRREVECDTIWLRHVRDDATVAPWVAGNFCDAQLTQKAPWLDLSAFADEAAYDQRYDSQQRKRRKKIRKTLEADIGPVAFKVLDHGAERKAAVALALAEKNKWIEERGRQNQVLGLPPPDPLSGRPFRRPRYHAHGRLLLSGGRHAGVLGNWPSLWRNAFRLHHVSRHRFDGLFSGPLAHGPVTTPSAECRHEGLRSHGAL